MATTANNLTNGGVTAHYKFVYDTSLAGSPGGPAGTEPARTNEVIAACENDFNLVTTWFRNLNLDVNFPIAVSIIPFGLSGSCSSAGACWSNSSGNLSVTISGDSLPTTVGQDVVRYLIVSEMVEQFMRVQANLHPLGRGWYGSGTEGSAGEGLSRFLAAQFLAFNGLGNPPPGFYNSNKWLTSDRTDYVNNINFSDDGPDAVTGCSLLFIYYLFSQLNFPVGEIIAAGAGANNLADVYKNLTGIWSPNPFPAFKRLVDSYFPGSSQITSGDLDNPFPLKKLRSNPGEILWHNSSTNETQIWFWDGHRVIERATVVDEHGEPIFVGEPWSIVGHGHFNTDANADIVWHNSSTNETQIWFMSRHRIVERATVVDEHGEPIFVGEPWSIVGTFGTLGDNTSEIVWHNSSTNETQIWSMRRERIVKRATVIDEDANPIFVGLPWRIVGAGDFKEDGIPDIVWHNSSTNETQIWFMGRGGIGNQITRRATVVDEHGNPIFVGKPWRIVGTGDSFLGDEREILWYNDSTNETQIWFTSGEKMTGRATVLDENNSPLLVGTPWSIVGTSFIWPNVLGWV